MQLLHIASYSYIYNQRRIQDGAFRANAPFALHNKIDRNFLIEHSLTIILLNRAIKHTMQSLIDFMFMLTLLSNNVLPAPDIKL